MNDGRVYLVDEYGNERLADRMYYFECPDCDYKSNHTFLQEEAEKEREAHESEEQPDGEWHGLGRIFHDELRYRLNG